MLPTGGAGAAECGYALRDIIVLGTEHHQYQLALAIMLMFREHLRKPRAGLDTMRPLQDINIVSNVRPVALVAQGGWFHRHAQAPAQLDDLVYQRKEVLSAQVKVRRESIAQKGPLKQIVQGVRLVTLVATGRLRKRVLANAQWDIIVPTESSIYVLLERMALTKWQRKKKTA